MSDQKIQPRTQALWPETGKQLGLSRQSTYEAAQRGEIPTIRIGRRVLVPLKQLDKLLGE